MPVSALTGEGIPELRRAIVDAIAPRGRIEQEGGFITSLRHEQLLRESQEALEQALTANATGDSARDAAARFVCGAAAHRRDYGRDYGGRYSESNFFDVLYRKIAFKFI